MIQRIVLLGLIAVLRQYGDTLWQILRPYASLQQTYKDLFVSFFVVSFEKEHEAKAQISR